jgi:hypothetical protein
VFSFSEYLCYFTRYWTLLPRTRFRTNCSTKNWRSSGSTATGGSIFWISYTEAGDGYPSSCGSVTNFLRLLAIYLLCGNILLNSRLKSGGYLFFWGRAGPGRASKFRDSLALMAWRQDLSRDLRRGSQVFKSRVYEVSLYSWLSKVIYGRRRAVYRGVLSINKVRDIRYTASYNEDWMTLYYNE